MDLIEKYHDKVQSLIEEAKAEGITIASYVREVNDITVEQGIAIIYDDNNHKVIPTWKR